MNHTTIELKQQIIQRQILALSLVGASVLILFAALIAMLYLS